MITVNVRLPNRDPWERNRQWTECAYTYEAPCPIEPGTRVRVIDGVAAGQEGLVTARPSHYTGPITCRIAPYA